MTPMKKRTLKYTSLLILALWQMVLPAQPQGLLVEGIVAVVGGNIILKSEVEEQFEALKRQSMGREFDFCDIVEDVMFQKLLIHHAEVDSVVVGDEEVESNLDRRIAQLIAQMGGDKRKLEEYYGKSVIEIKEEMRDLMKDQLVAQRMQFTIGDGVEITPTEVQDYFNSIPQDSLPLINTEVEIAQIVKYPEVSREAELEVIEKLKSLKERIEKGSSFASMAILYSEDPGSNKTGGEYKNIKRGQFVKEFESVAFNLKKGEISNPFKTEYGFHIVQLIEKRGEEIDVRHILIKPKLTQQDLAEARAFLDSVYSMIERKEITWEEATSKFSEDDQTRFNAGIVSNFETGDTKFELGQLDRSVFNAIKDLKSGEISKPDFYRTAEQKEAFRIVKLVNKIEPHKANMKDDYQRLKDLALQQKQMEKVNNWISEKIKETYIKVNQEYLNGCQLDSRWLKQESNRL
jgi:peptidyl-prolyl cis-trans isomerase SurA